MPKLVNPKLALYRDQGRFGEQLERWIEIFGRGRVHVILFEDLANEPAETYQRLLEFLDVDPTFRPSSFSAHNLSWTPRSHRLRRITQSRPAKWLAYTALPRLLGERTSRRLTRVIRYSRFYRKNKPRAPLSPALRAQLENEFAPDLARLSAIVGQDLFRRWFGRSTPPQAVAAATQSA